MITDRVKANAIARLKLGDSAEVVSSMLDIPLMLVKTWQEDLGLDDLTALQANSMALARVFEGPVSTDNVDKLKNRLEETALEIVEAISLNLPIPDIVQAKALSLMADSCSKLYLSIVSKIGRSPLPGDAADKAKTLFEQLAKD